MTYFKDSVTVITGNCVHVFKFNACKMADPNTISILRLSTEYNINGVIETLAVVT